MQLLKTLLLLMLFVYGTQASHAQAQQIFITPALTKISLCQGDTVHVNYTVSQNFNPANIFTAELSNPSGVFLTPVPIGTLTSVAGGKIVCAIPITALAGTTYRIRVSASDPIKSSADNGVDITIKPRPVTSITTSSPACLGDTLRVFASSVPLASTFSWTFADGSTASAYNITFFSTPAAYAGPLKIVGELNGCKDSATTIIAVKTPPDTPHLTANGPLCEGDTLRLTAVSATTGAAYSWTGPGFSSSLQNPVLNNIATANAGMYLALAHYNGCRSVAGKINVAVISKPPKPVASSNTPICEGEDLKLSAIDVPGARYLWTGPYNFLTNIQNVIVPSLPAAFATGYYIVTDSIGKCGNSDTIYVVINPYPAKPSITGDIALCAGDTLMLHAGNTSLNAHYTWTGPGNFTDTTQHPVINTVTTSRSGLYSIMGAIGACVTYGDTADVVVTPLPEMPAAQNNGPLTEGQDLRLTAYSATPGVKYAWTGPNGYSSNEQYPVLPLADKTLEGTYIVTAEAKGCSISALTTVVVNEAMIKDNFSLYPNPNNGNFTIKSKLAFDQRVQMKINNAQGQLIYDMAMDGKGKGLSQTVQLKDKLAAGTYFLKILIDGHVIKLPFTVVR